MRCSTPSISFFTPVSPVGCRTVADSVLFFPEALREVSREDAGGQC